MKYLLIPFLTFAMVLMSFSCGSVSPYQSIYEAPADDAWATELPDGLGAGIQVFDEYTLFIRYTNHTGTDIELTTYYAFADENQAEIGQGIATRFYFPDGTDYVAMLDSPEPFTYYRLALETAAAPERLSRVYDGLQIDAVRQFDGSVLLNCSYVGNDGVSVDGEVVFLGENDVILGCESFGLGFSGRTDIRIAAPGYDYTDYILSYEPFA